MATLKTSIPTVVKRKGNKIWTTLLMDSVKLFYFIIFTTFSIIEFNI